MILIVHQGRLQLNVNIMRTRNFNYLLPIREDFSDEDFEFEDYDEDEPEADTGETSEDEETEEETL